MGKGYAVEQRYELYCLVDRHFYDAPERARGARDGGRHSDSDEYELARGPVPEGWKRHVLDDWLVYQPVGVELPAQGWKIHASASLDSAGAILAATWEYCVARRIPFKFIAGPQRLFLRNVKYSPRGSSGKFITIYPADEAQLERVLTELGALLAGLTGPYILSDLRWGDGPLYVRYGGFAERWCVGESGERELAIADPDGRLVPDRRGPTFRVPPWVSLPSCLAPHLEARNATTLEDLPYRIERPLHFSNGGGLYAAVDTRGGDRVVLKEARPHAALALDRADAVARLRHERDMLARLEGIDAVPRLRDYFAVGGHEFLVEDFVDGGTLSSLIVQRWPLFAREVDEAAAAEYATWALAACAGVERAVDAVHGRGVVIGDLHPNNMMVRPDGRVVLIDLEVATRAQDGGRPALAAAGFMPPALFTGVDVDRYALACLRLHIFMPITPLLVIDRGKAPDIADAIGELFPVVPRAFLDEAVEVLTTALGGRFEVVPRPSAGTLARAAIPLARRPA